jgi:pyridoxal phosphate enzyme (YggS family)
MLVARNLARVHEQIASAARRAGRNSEQIALMAVTKTVPPDQIREAYDVGVRMFGENRVQEFEEKVDVLSKIEGIEWHMIGHLQTNKAVRAADLFDSVDSVDSVRLARKLNSAALELGKKLPVLIEINIAGEEAKSGVAPDSRELHELLNSAPDLPSLGFHGLMTVPPYSESPEESRPYFRKMRELFAHLSSRKLGAVQMNVLSMGMSHDFEVAIEEGATCVRIGTAIFGERRL